MTKKSLYSFLSPHPSSFLPLSPPRPFIPLPFSSSFFLFLSPLSPQHPFQVLQRLGLDRGGSIPTITKADKQREGDSPIYYIKMPPLPYYYVNSNALQQHHSYSAPIHPFKKVSVCVCVLIQDEKLPNNSNNNNHNHNNNNNNHNNNDNNDSVSQSENTSNETYN